MSLSLIIAIIVISLIESKSLLKNKWKNSKTQKFIKLIENKKNISQYTFTEPQVNAILELRLQKLTALGINEIELEIKLKDIDDDPLVGNTVFRSPEEEGFAIDLNILFDVGKSDIKPEYYEKLDNLIKYMRYKDFKIRVEGHTDKQGNSNVNKRISLERANSVKKYIVSNGISEGRVNAIGYGEDRPAYNYIGDSEVNELNRRIEIVIE